MAFREEFDRQHPGCGVRGALLSSDLAGGEVTGWCFSSLNHQPGTDQPGVY